MHFFVTLGGGLTSKSLSVVPNNDDIKNRRKQVPGSSQPNTDLCVWKTEKRFLLLSYNHSSTVIHHLQR